MNRLPFSMPGRFWRGNLHTHSTNSDGNLSPAETVAWYRDSGYDFVAMTDHCIGRFGFPITDTRSLRTGDFTTLIGAELHAPRIQVGNLWHIVAAGLPHDFDVSAPGETGPALAARAGARSMASATSSAGAVTVGTKRTTTASTWASSKRSGSADA